jgi:asparagine synthase (glutamine-hydrolysing)
MCGIAGVFGLDGRPVPPGVDVVTMAEALAHRGPDDAGAYQDPAVRLGFRRLAFLDLPGGNQPHHSPDGTVVAVANGEIFNHEELRSRLAGRGHVFRTGVDTEVLVHLYLEYGPDLVDHLDGQFAFAIYDARRRRLVLARDHFGIVPLHYTVVAGQLVFGSEIKSILRHPDVPRRVDLAGLDQVLTLPGLVSPRTMFDGIFSLRPGERLLADEYGVRTERYWDLDYPVGPVDAPGTLDEYADGVRERLTRSVRARMRADVPVGMYLSGGLDSTLIGALMTRHRPGTHSFSIDFAEASLTEGRHQRLAAEALGTRHRSVRATSADVVDLLPRMVRHAEMPVRETYNVCSLLLSGRARADGVLGILSGEGADEFFGGYPGYRFDALVPRAAGGLEAHLEREAAERMWGLDLRYEQDMLPALELRRELYSAEVGAVLDDHAVTTRRLVDPERLRGRHPLHQRSYLDFTLRLADHLLGDHGDRMAMANGVELRLPFLSRDLVEYAATIPPELMVRDGQEKAVLRHAAAGLVPEEIRLRQKFGFRAHSSTHLLREHGDWFRELLAPDVLAKQGYFAPDVVAELVRRQTAPDASVHPHLDTDYLLLIATFTLFVEEFGL